MSQVVKEQRLVKLEKQSSSIQVVREQKLVKLEEQYSGLQVVKEQKLRSQEREEPSIHKEGQEVELAKVKLFPAPRMDGLTEIKEKPELRPYKEGHRRSCVFTRKASRCS